MFIFDYALSYELYLTFYKLISITVQYSFAQIKFNSDGTPIAERFDDVYFSNDDGMAETAYVFIKNNQLPERWREVEANSFVIAETGFGSGLNFLVAAETFIQYRQQHPRENGFSLHFISTEKYPMRAEDARKTLERFSQLTLCEPLISQWPINTEGCHRIEFLSDTASITLDLWIGDVLAQFPNIQNKSNGLVDAWFLDGFAPSKNPDMWQQTLFDQMFRLSKPSATFATFTAAGFVKRGLQAAGFCVEKRKGYGRKRDMLAGHVDEQQPFDHRRCARNVTPFFNRDANTDFLHSGSQKHIVIAGGGLAAASLSYSLARKGVSSTLLVKDDAIAKGASGNPQGGFYPQLNAQPSIISQIQLNSFLYAKRTYDALIQSGQYFSHEWCGVLLIGFSEEVRKRQQNLIETEVWPDSVIAPVSATQASGIAGIDIPYSGLFVSEGGWLSPPELVNAFICAAKQLCNVNIIVNAELSSYKASSQALLNSGVTAQYNLKSGDNDIRHSIDADALVIATGHNTTNIQGFSSIPTALTRGQVEAIPTQPHLSNLATVLCHKGYLTPAMQGHHALGSTYVKNDVKTEYRESEQQQNLAMHARSLADCDWAKNLMVENQGRAAIRCSTPDHLPLVGALPDLEKQQEQYANYGGKRPHLLAQTPSNIDSIYMLTGLGSRGLTTAPLMAEILACQILGRPMPLASKLLDALSPNRFLLRNLKRS